MSLLQTVGESPLVYRLGYGLVHFLWEGALIAALLALSLAALRGRPAARHAAAWLALAAMAVAVPLTVCLVGGPATPSRGGPMSPPPLAGRANLVGVGPATNPGSSPLTSGMPVTRAEPAVGPAVPPVEPPAPSGAPLPGVERLRTVSTDIGGFALGRWPPWLVGGWAAGAGLLSLWRLVGWLAARRLCRRGVEPAPAELQLRLDCLAERLRVRPAVRLLVSLRAEVPAVIGWLRPVILLPAGIVTGLSPRELELILAHELAHVRRWDFLANLVQTAVETCLFYHPAVWWVSRRIRVEREHCCDDAVVSATEERVLYARALAHVVELSGSRRSAGPALAADGGVLLERIRRVLGLPEEPRRWAAARVIGGGAALAVVAALVGLASLVDPDVPAGLGGPAVAVAGVLSAPGNGGTTGPDGPAEPAAPRVVGVFPADGARDVDPLTEIRLRFDQPMDPSRALLWWPWREPAGFRPRGPMRYDEATHTFSWPVQLTPGSEHRITTQDRFAQVRPWPSGFGSARGVLAEPFAWSFTTAEAPPTQGTEPPRVTSIDPPPDTELALLTPVRVTFDRPMDPTFHGALVPDPIPSKMRGVFALVEPPVYDAQVRTFTLLVTMPPNWNGEVRLVGFRSAEGAEAAPISFPYRTLREPLAAAIRARVGRDDPELGQFIERVRAARRERTALYESVVETSVSRYQEPGWSQSLDMSGATFAMRGDGLYFGEIDEDMGRPFRVGSDGVTCWFRRGNDLMRLPVGAVARQQVLIADPFTSGAPIGAAELIRTRQLEDLGEVEIDGRPCRKIRSWNVRVFVDEIVTPPTTWYIETETLLPVRVETGFSAREFTHHLPSKSIPDDLFRPQTGPDIREVKNEPLSGEYTYRFLNVNDGSGGRMSVRWGREGPGGRVSSGLN